MVQIGVARSLRFFFRHNDSRILYISLINWWGKGLDWSISLKCNLDTQKRALFIYIYIYIIISNWKENKRNTFFQTILVSFSILNSRVTIQVCSMGILEQKKLIHGWAMTFKRIFNRDHPQKVRKISEMSPDGHKISVYKKKHRIYLIMHKKFNSFFLFQKLNLESKVMTLWNQWLRFLTWTSGFI